jgi:hypothetical protein
MADFAVAAMAAEPSFGVAPGTFLRAYEAALDDGNETAALADPVAIALTHLVADRGAWKGSAAELLEQLPSPAHVEGASWPTSPTALGNRLVRLRPSLHRLGVDATYARTAKARVWSFARMTTPEAVPATDPVPSADVPVIEE